MRFLRMIIVIILFLVLFLLGDFYTFLLSPVQLAGNRLIVASGDGYLDFRERLLFANRSILAPFYYRIYTYIHGGVVRPGVRIYSDATLKQVLDSVVELPTDLFVRLPEGERMEYFASVLGDYAILPKTEALNCFRSCQLKNYLTYFSPKTGYEGFLFPDTYSFMPDSDKEVVLEKLLNNFQIRFDPLAKKYEKFLADHSLRDVVIVASLLEREAKTLQDKRIIAGILYARLAKDIRLDVDATVLYAKGDWLAPLTNADLNSESPYNTRRVKGLPPGPICNPGLESIEAAMSPQATPYLFYLTGSNGQMYYAKTLEEHNQNKQNYL